MPINEKVRREILESYKETEIPVDATATETPVEETPKQESEQTVPDDVQADAQQKDETATTPPEADKGQEGDEPKIDDYLPPKPDAKASPEIKKQYEEGVKGITKAFTKLDQTRKALLGQLNAQKAEYEAKLAGISEREKECEKIESAMALALDGHPEAFRSIPLSYILKNHPEGKEVAAKQASQESEIKKTGQAIAEYEQQIEKLKQDSYELFLRHQSLLIRNQLVGMGYTEAEIKAYSADPNNIPKFEKAIELLQAGVELPIVVQNMGFIEKKPYNQPRQTKPPTYTAPRTTGNLDTIEAKRQALLRELK